MEQKYDIIYGEHACLSVLLNKSRHIFEILVIDELKLPNKYFDLYKKIIKVVNKKQIEKICRIEDKHQGIVMKIGKLVMQTNLYDLIDSLESDKFHYGFILDKVQDPNNVGAIIRSAYCFGSSFIILPKNDSPSINNTIIRASTGYSESLPIYYVSNLAREIDKLKEYGFWIIGLDSNINSEMPEKIINTYDKRIIFVLGSEGFGIRDLVKQKCDCFIKIPMVVKAESLNVSNAAAIISYLAFLKK